MKTFDQLIRAKTKGIELKNNEKVNIKIPKKEGGFWEREYNQSDPIENVINDFKRENDEEFPEEYITDWKHDNESFNLKAEIRTILPIEVPTLIDNYCKKNPSQFSDENIPKLVGKPFFDPFEIFVFHKEEKTLKIQKYDRDTIENNNLDDYGTSSAYCNGCNYLFISGGENNNSEIIDKFWKINLGTQEIETTNMIYPKKNHSMVYVSKFGKSVFIVGGNDLKTFYYDIDNNTMIEWGDLNHKRTEPALILISDTLYCIDNVNSKDYNEPFSLEKTNVTSQNQKWDIIYPELNISKNEKLNQKFFGVVKTASDEILFLGGNMDEKASEFNYKYNISSETIEDSNIPFKEYNFKEKTFLPYKENVDYILPDFNRYHPEVIFYQKNKNKLSFVNYEPKNNNKLKTAPRKDYKFNFNMPLINSKEENKENIENIDNLENIENIENIDNKENLIKNKENININNEENPSDKELSKIDDNKNHNKTESFKEPEKDVQNQNIKISIGMPEDKINSIYKNDIKNTKDLLSSEKNSLNPYKNKESLKSGSIGGEINFNSNIPVDHQENALTNMSPSYKENIIKPNVFGINAQITSSQPNINMGMDIDSPNLNPQINLPKTKNPEVDIKQSIKGPEINIKTSDKSQGTDFNLKGIIIGGNNKSDKNIKGEKNEFFLKGIIRGDKNAKKNSQNFKESGIIEGINQKELKSANIKPNVDLNLKNSEKININENHRNNSNYMSGIIKGVNVSKINAPNMNIKSSNINLEGNLPGIDFKGPNINIPSRGTDINFNKDINLNQNLIINGPGIDIQNNGSNINGDINAPKIDLNSKNIININGPEFGQDGPKININGPKIDVPNFNINGPKIDEPNFNINGPKIDEPNFNINGPKIDEPNINGPKIDIKNDLPEIKIHQKVNLPSGNMKLNGPNINKKIDLNKNISGGVEINSPNISGKIPNVNIKGSEIQGIIPGIDVKSSQFEGIIPGINVNTNIKNSKDFYCSGFIKGTTNGIESSNIKIPGVEVNAPKMELNGKINDININGPKIDINAPSTNLDLKGADYKLNGNIQGINNNQQKVNIPSFNMEQKNIKMGGGIKLEGKDVNLKGDIPGIKIDTKINNYFYLEGIIPSNKMGKITYDSNMQPIKISAKAPSLENNSKNLNFHGNLNDFGNEVEIRGSRKMICDDGGNNLNLEAPKIEINGNGNIIGSDNIELGGGKINLINTHPTKLGVKNIKEENDFGINVNIDGGFKKGDINLGNLGQNFVGEENTETKILLSSLMTGGTGIKKKGKGLPIVGAKNSNFEPSKIDAAGRLDVENINVENLKSANVGVNGQKIGERVVE